MTQKYELTSDGSNNKFVETEYTWYHKEISTGDTIPADSIGCYGPYYPAISQEDKYFYEGNSTYQIHTRKRWDHGSFGNIKNYYNDGDVAYSTDDISAEIVYTYDLTNYYMGMVDQLNVYDYQSTLLRQREGIYNTTTGRIEQVAIYDGTVYAYTDIDYDSYGNISQIEYPENTNSNRLSYDYEYDLSVHTYPTLITDYWGNSSSSTYDYRLGAPLVVTDPTGNEMHYSYYDDGKLETVTGPNEVLANIPYTIKCEYWDEQASVNYFWAKTTHYDTLNTGNRFITINFSDGIGRSIQSKKKATIFGVDSIVISGRAYIDTYGRVDSVSQPATEALGNETNFTSFSPVNFTTTDFDVLDRPLAQYMPDGTDISYVYDFGTDAFSVTCFETEITDPESNTTAQYTNATGLKTSVHAPLSTVTKFTYSPLGELLSSTDPEANTTEYEYDMLGRLTERDHPDAGTTSYAYDLAGNVLATQTENLENTSDSIKYHYTDLRLSQIEYPYNSAMDVYYEYGSPDATCPANQRGRLVRMQDASGVQTFEYGNMGELIKNTHTYVVPTTSGEAYTFETQWEYDSWNRISSITYPDAEVVTYEYDNGGKLIEVDGNKAGRLTAFIDSIFYDKYGARTSIYYGNGTYAKYSYDDENRRLTNLLSFESDNDTMQNITYSYDDVGNITGLVNNSEFAYGNTGGDYVYNYTYDNLYRLDSASGSFTHYNGTAPFSMKMTYSSSGNITNKKVSATTLIAGTTGSISYDNAYSYNDRPHTVTDVGSVDYGWDDNGNMVLREDDDQVRYMCWDEENRLAVVRDSADGEERPSQLSVYLYDGGGERVWKLTGQEAAMDLSGESAYQLVNFEKTLYLSPLMVMTESKYTKHYYIEGERITSKVGKGFGVAPYMPADSVLEFITNDDVDDISSALDGMVEEFIDCTNYNDLWNIETDLSPAENELNRIERLKYYYHSDHLGSASFITDAYGQTKQHLQYLPYGESFIDQRNSYSSRYTFSAKEKDDETQYSYFGARYYDSDLSVWLSVDPLADEYASTSPYMYVMGNPLNLVDPFGMNAWLPPTDGSDQWTAETGDCAWTLHEDAGISFEDAKSAVGDMNSARGKGNTLDVYEGDKVGVGEHAGSDWDGSGGWFTVVSDKVEAQGDVNPESYMGETTITNEGATELLANMASAYAGFFTAMVFTTAFEAIGIVRSSSTPQPATNSNKPIGNNVRGNLVKNMYQVQTRGSAHWKQPGHGLYPKSVYTRVIRYGNMTWNPNNQTYRFTYKSTYGTYKVGIRPDGGIMHSTFY